MDAKIDDVVASNGHPAVRDDLSRISTGVVGLDTVLDGGLPAGRHHLVRGGPGSGKTTLVLHCLAAGSSVDGQTLYVSLSTAEADLRSDAAGVNLDLENVVILDLSAPNGLPTIDDYERHLTRQDQELTPVVQAILGWARMLTPSRVAIDSLTRLRELIPEVTLFRAEVLSLVRGLTELGATVVSTSEYSDDAPDSELQFLADGVVSLEVARRNRKVQVTKLRGSGFRPGEHTVRVTEQGMAVYPRLAVQQHEQRFSAELLSFGIPEVNELLHGGLHRGTTTLISGPSGVGKTTFGAQFIKEAAGRGERSVLITFDESEATFIHRCESISIPVQAMIDRGTLAIIPIEPATSSPDEIAAIVRAEVEDQGAAVVMIDSVASYQLAIDPETEGVEERLHDLMRYLNAAGVTGLLIDETRTVTGDFAASEHGLSYLADAVVFFRHIEVRGKLSQAIGMLKKRTGGFENSLRAFEITEHGIKVGAPLEQLRGVLSGMPAIAEDGSERSNHVR